MKIDNDGRCLEPKRDGIGCCKILCEGDDIYFHRPGICFCKVINGDRYVYYKEELEKEER